MPSFIFMAGDAFDQRFRRSATGVRADRAGTVADSDRPAVRRPHRGLQVKEDTYATFSVFNARGESLPLISESSRTPGNDVSGRGQVKQYADFTLQQVHVERVEKEQVVETFGQDYIFFFGEKPRVATIQGLLVNSEDFNWRSQFWSNWDSTIRGTKLVQNNARFFLAYDTIVLEGYPLRASTDESMNEPHLVPFTMTIFVTNTVDFSYVGDVMFPNQDLPQQSVYELNRQLREQADQFNGNAIPSQVRNANILGTPSGASLTSALAEVAKFKNNIFSVADAVRAGAFGLLNNRVVTVPLGVAGFVEQVGAQQFAAGSVAFDAATRYALTSRGIEVPVLVDQQYFTVPQNMRGRKSDAIDEYPLSANQAYDVPAELQKQLEMTRRLRQLDDQERSADLIRQNLQAQTEGDLLRGVAAGIQFAQKAFTMVKTTANVVQSIANSDNPGAATASFVANALAPGVAPGLKRFADPAAARSVELSPGQQRFRDPAASGVVSDTLGQPRLRSSDAAEAATRVAGGEAQTDAAAFLEAVRNGQLSGSVVPGSETSAAGFLSQFSEG